jgi:anti-sigma-K factor RskA
LNIEEYISTGILELYALGQLSPGEVMEVEDIVAKYPRVKEELNAIESALEKYAFSVAKNPSPQVKAKILAQLERDDVSPVRDLPKAKGGPSSEKQMYWPYLAAACVVIAVLFAGTTFYYWQKWKKTEDQLIALQQESIEITSNYNKVKNDLGFELDNYKNFVKVVRDPGTKRIELAGLPISPDSKVIVFWNSESNEVFVDPLKLPEPPTHQQYQLWALENGKPVDAGTISSINSGAIQKMKQIRVAQAFAITLEKKGGSSSPTMEKMYVMGKI